MRVGEHQPGQRELLGLGGAELVRPVTEEGVEAVGQAGVPVGADRGQRRAHPVVGGVRGGEREVVV